MKDYIYFILFVLLLSSNSYAEKSPEHFQKRFEARIVELIKAIFANYDPSDPNPRYSLTEGGHIVSKVPGLDGTYEVHIYPNHNNVLLLVHNIIEEDRTVTNRYFYNIGGVVGSNREVGGTRFFCGTKWMFLDDEELTFDQRVIAPQSCKSFFNEVSRKYLD